LLKIYIDADACPVKSEVFRVAERYELDVALVSNTDDIVISADIPLASRCLEKGARVLGPKGRVFTKNNIGDIMATREIMSHLRDLGTMTGGPAPFQKKDRSRFLQSLDRMIQSIKIKNP